jgi:hypothetical protein
MNIRGKIQDAIYKALEVEKKAMATQAKESSSALAN